LHIQKERKLQRHNKEKEVRSWKELSS